MSQGQLADNSGQRLCVICGTELEPSSTFYGSCGQASEGTVTHDAPASLHYRLPLSDLGQIVGRTLARRYPILVLGFALLPEIATLVLRFIYPLPGNDPEFFYSPQFGTDPTNIVPASW